MKLHDRLILYERTVTSDGAGGKKPGVLVEVARLWGNVRPMGGLIGMQFQQINGTQGYEITTRTDFAFDINREYIIVYEAIHGDQQMIIHSIQTEKNYTKLICQSENKSPVQTT